MKTIAQIHKIFAKCWPASLIQRRCLHKKCIIYHTNNVNPFENLAFEDWMYEKVNFTETDCLFIWQNQPCVVIGRHQNPWKESHVKMLQNDDVKLCRRSSGGGAVYHDLGNVNFTFFTDRKGYNRRPNLQTIIDGVKSKFPSMDLTMNCRDDILLNEKFKVSGSSAKLGPKSAYHHCTLLLNSNKEILLKYLTSKPFSFQCKSTASIRSSVMNLSDIDSSITFEDVRHLVSESYASKHSTSEVFTIDTSDRKLLPNIESISQKLETWEWRFGKTPEFSIEKEFHCDNFGLTSITVSVKKGLISDIVISSPTISDEIKRNFSELLINVRFCWDDVFAALKESEFDIEPLQNFNLLSKYVLQFLN